MSMVAVHSTSALPVRERLPDIGSIIEKLCRKHSQASEDMLAQRLRDRLADDADLLLAVARHLVHAALINRDRRQARQAAEPTPKERAARKAREKQEIAHVAEKARASIVLDFMTPLNLKVRFCTGLQLKELGGSFSRLGDAVPDNVLCGEVLTAAEAHRLFHAK
jgi:hypothetical protein